MEGRATKGSPLGCFTGVLALIPLAFALASAWGLVRWWSAPENKRPEGSLGILLTGFGFGALAFGLLAWLSLRILRSTDWKRYKPEDDTSLHY